jgi:hypothetical protein
MAAGCPLAKEEEGWSEMGESDFPAGRHSTSYLRLPTQSWRDAFSPRGPDLPDEPPRHRRRRWGKGGGGHSLWFLIGLVAGLGSAWTIYHLPLHLLG